MEKFEKDLMRRSNKNILRLFAGGVFLMEKLRRFKNGYNLNFTYRKSMNFVLGSLKIENCEDEQHGILWSVNN